MIFRSPSCVVPEWGKENFEQASVSRRKLGLLYKGLRSLLFRSPKTWPYVSIRVHRRAINVTPYFVYAFLHVER